jgi:hypothetical protein
MFDPTTHWFYSSKMPGAGAIAENMRHDFWEQHVYGVWFTCTRHENPYTYRGLWQGKQFEVEVVPRQYLIVRSQEDLAWIVEGFKRVLCSVPTFKYQEPDGRYAAEWRMTERETRWQAMQGKPAFKNLKRLDMRPTPSG